MEELRRRYPRNRLVLLEAGATAIRAGRPAAGGDAPDAKGMRMLANGRTAADSGRRGALALQARRRPCRAAAATEAPCRPARGAQGRTRRPGSSGRARVELGRLALSAATAGPRRARRARRQTLCEQGNDPVCVDRAQKLMRSADGR